MSSQGDALRRTLLAADAKVRAELAIEIATRVDMAMPVDTGWARANTVLSTGQPAGSDAAEGDVPGALAAQAAGIAAVLDADPAADIIVSNRVPYVPALNRGHSPQAPAGFLEQAVDDAVAAVQARENARIVKL